MYVAAMQQNPMMIMPYMAAQYPLYSRMALPNEVSFVMLHSGCTRVAANRVSPKCATFVVIQ